MAKTKTYDVIVVGAGVFGAWTALHLARRGQRVLLVDAYGPANARASSGGESRIIRMGYGADELYTRWAINSLAQWKELFASAPPSASAPLFHETGVLWLAGEGDKQLGATKEVLTRCKVPFESLNREAIAERYPQFALHGIDTGVLETGSGVLMARRSVMAVVEQAASHGVEYRQAHVGSPTFAQASAPQLDAIKTSNGEKIAAGQFIFACGAWLGKVFPEILGARIFPSRQEVFFFGVPPGHDSFGAKALPTWLIQCDEVYGMPDLESRGFKIALDHHGERVDPDTQSRVVSPESSERVRAYVTERFPALRNAPIVEMRVCQYENTSNGDFLIDRHPQLNNVWFAGGGSGHGFKHGPAFGEYAARQLLEGGPAEQRFSLTSKATEQKRAVY
ncbi:MAG: FAD-dependent oxidoreductase [Candidatus Acidiferrum sp.]